MIEIYLTTQLNMILPNKMINIKHVKMAIIMWKNIKK